MYTYAFTDHSTGPKGFSIRSIASQLLWVDSCEVSVGCGSITERTERTEFEDERSRTTGLSRKAIAFSCFQGL